MKSPTDELCPCCVDIETVVEEAHLAVQAAKKAVTTAFKHLPAEDRAIRIEIDELLKHLDAHVGQLERLQLALFEPKHPLQFH